MNASGPAGHNNQEGSDEEPLLEKDFIHEGRLWGPLPAWIWIFLLSILIICVTGMYNWYGARINQEKMKEPFLEVTNRQFSVFLWQFPSFLRINSPIKTGYLPGFKSDGEGIQLSAVEEFVSAPPELIFLYHTWSRLLASEYTPRPISAKSFEEFLNQTQEWLPAYWKNAPKEYVEMIKSEKYKELEDLQTLSEVQLPLVVRQSFQGWKNYFEEGPDINALQPSFGEIEEFLKQHPHYARNYWRNIDTIAKQPVAGMNYLAGFLKSPINAQEEVPKDQLTPFLKVALFNAQQAKLQK